MGTNGMTGVLQNIVDDNKVVVQWKSTSSHRQPAELEFLDPIFGDWEPLKLTIEEIGSSVGVLHHFRACGATKWLKRYNKLRLQRITGDVYFNENREKLRSGLAEASSLRVHAANKLRKSLVASLGPDGAEKVKE